MIVGSCTQCLGITSESAFWTKKAASKFSDGQQTLGGQGTRKNPDEEIFIFVIGSFRSVACCHQSQSFRAITARFGFWHGLLQRWSSNYVATTNPVQDTQHSRSFVSHLFAPCHKKAPSVSPLFNIGEEKLGHSGSSYITSCFQPLETVSGVWHISSNWIVRRGRPSCWRTLTTLQPRFACSARAPIEQDLIQ